MADQVDSTADDRTVNNAVRHQYRVLTDAEKAQMLAIKDQGAAAIATVEQLLVGADQKAGRCYSLARTKLEEAVMWAVKGITG